MNVNATRALPLFALGLAGLLSACQARQTELDARFGSANSTHLAARAALVAAHGGAASGEVQLSQLVTEDSRAKAAVNQVLLYAKVSGLEPKPHALRVHEGTSCDAPQGLLPAGRYARALAPSASGDATVSLALGRVSLEDGHAHALVGKTLVLHEGANAEGPAVACGVIERVAQADPHAAHGDHAAPAAGHEGHDHAAPAAGHDAPAPAAAPEAGHEGHGH